MKFGTAFNYTFSLATLAIGTAAQSVSIIAPAANSRVTAGQPVRVSIAFADTTSSVDVLALFLGAKFSNDPDANDLGQTKLAVSMAPQFDSTGPQGQFVHNIDVTFPTDLINGLNQTYSLTCGEFFTLGAENTPFTNTVQIPVFVSSV